MTDLLTLSKALIACPSISPDDAGCQAIVTDLLTTYGFTVRALPFADVDNLWAYKKGAAEGKTLVFAGHTDVVPPGDVQAWRANPFMPYEQNGFLYGRGAADMKGALAAMLIAGCQFTCNRKEYAGRVAFLLTSDEEALAENGTKAVMQQLIGEKTAIDAVIIGEPSSDRHLGDTLRHGRRGSITFTLTVKGVQGHVAYPHLADNPIHKIGTLINLLQQYKWDQGTADFPPTSLQIVRVEAGGGATNVIPETATLVCNLRFSTLHTPQSITETIHTLLKKAGVATYTYVKSRISGLPFLTATTSNLVHITQQAVIDVCGKTPQLSTGGGTSDGRFISPYGIDVVELGVRNKTAHKVDECVAIADLHNLVTIYTKLLQRFFNRQ